MKKNQAVNEFSKKLETIYGKKVGGLTLFYKLLVNRIDRYIFCADIVDFFELSFYKKSLFEKLKYQTIRPDTIFSYTVDPISDITKYNNKKIMYSVMKSYVKRDQLFFPECTYDEFCSFIKKHPSFIYKPDLECCGRGIEKITVLPDEAEAVYNKLSAKNGIADELIEQHPDLAKLCNKCVNTVRVFTLRIGDEITFIGAALRMGIGNSVVDNYSAGGVVGAIDLQTGKVIDSLEDFLGIRYEEHPYSHIYMKGYQIPLWQEVCDFIRDASRVFPINYAAWDIAIRQNDCVLVEANTHGMVNVIQIAGAGGRKKQYKELLKKWNDAHR